MSITGSAEVPAGTYLIREQVLSIAYRPEHALARCAQCARKIDPHSPFYPCTDCTKAVFCSRRCRRKFTPNRTGSAQSVHAGECCLVAVFDSAPLALHAYRMVASLGLEKVVRFYHQKQDLESGVSGVFGQQQQDLQQDLNQPNRARFELLDSESQLRAFAIVDSFVGHEDAVTKEESEHCIETLLWALKVVLLVNHQQRK